MAEPAVDRHRSTCLHSGTRRAHRCPKARGIHQLARTRGPRSDGSGTPHRPCMHSMGRCRSLEGRRCRCPRSPVRRSSHRSHVGTRIQGTPARGSRDKADHLHIDALRLQMRKADAGRKTRPVHRYLPHRQSRCPIVHRMRAGHPMRQRRANRTFLRSTRPPTRKVLRE